MERSIRDLTQYLPILRSVSVVPVGLDEVSRWIVSIRAILQKEEAKEVIRTIEKWQKKVYAEYGIHFIHAGDEWYLLAEEEVPEEERYDGYLQLENGVGMLRLLFNEFEEGYDTADVIIFITDVKQGLVDSDSKVADMLRRSHKPVVLVVNKVDSFEKYMTDVYEFYNLGIGDPHPISAASMLGLGDMLDEVVKHFPDSSKQDDEDDRPRVAIVGKPNVGKSSLINKLAREDRVIVSDIAGTTRDAIDTAIKYDGKEYIFIDTAGLRRKNKIKEDIERYSIIRAVSAVERADVVIVVIDATEGVTEQDAKIAGIAHERGNQTDIKLYTICRDTVYFGKIRSETQQDI